MAGKYVIVISQTNCYSSFGSQDVFALHDIALMLVSSLHCTLQHSDPGTMCVNILRNFVNCCRERQDGIIYRQNNG